MNKKSFTYFMYGLLVLLLLGLDQWTKIAIERSLDLYERIIVIPRFFALTYVQNRGAGFSIFTGYSMWFFGILTIICVAVLLYMLIKSKDLRIQLSLCLVLAGAIGNFIDRMMLGYVRDFFSMNIFGWAFPVFNVADICITVGFALIILVYLLEDIKEKKRWKQDDLK